MSRINRDIYTSLDVNGPYIRIDTQPTDTTSNHNGDAVFTLAASTYYMTGDEAEIGDIDTLETDAVAPTDPSLDNLTPGVPHTAKNDGYISYQWYEIDANSTPIGAVTKLTDSTVYTGTTTNTLTVKNVQSPGTHLNQYYCVLDYIPNLTDGQYDTGNATNDTVTSDIVTLNVRPFLIIDKQPVTTNTLLNPNSGITSTTASLSDTRTPWENYKLEFQWWERDKLNEAAVPNTRLVDGIYNKNLSTILSEETVVDQIQTTTLIESVSSGVTKRVGIPTEAISVEFSISGGKGGSGGNDNANDLGGSGGSGRDGNFRFSDSEISLINNASGPTEYVISSGASGNDGSEGASAAGGLGGLSYDLKINLSDIDRDSAQGGKGGDSGPGGISGSGGGGGGASAVIRVDSREWMAIAGGGGGGGGASFGASGEDGNDAGEWGQFNATTEVVIDDARQATVVNYNPVAGTPEGGNKQDSIDYGIYIKSTSPISSVDATTNYRVVVIWDGETIIDTTSRLTFDDGTQPYSNGISYYLESGNYRYYVSSYRGSQLGWCNNDSLDSICIRGDGEYANAFDVGRRTIGIPNSTINPYDGFSGVTKITGNGGGGGGGGGGSLDYASGGTAGADPIPADRVSLTFKVTKNASDSQIGSRYIKFVENSWYGFPETQPPRGETVTVNRSFGTQTISLKTNTTYDVVSSFEAGDRTSDSLRILQDFAPPDANAVDVIAGRSIGMNLSGVGDNIQTGNESDFLDFIVSVSDGTFDVFPETVRLDDGEILGKAIIRFTTPAEVKNSTAATGGEGGESVYDTNRLEKISSGSLNDGQGSVSMTIVTQQPFDVLDTDVTNISITRQYQVSGAHPYTPYKDSGYTSNLEITSDYVFSKRILCQITVKDTSVSPATNAITSGSNTLYTNIVDFIVSDDRDNTITVEQIRHNDDFAITRALNLINGDLTFEKTTDTSIKETEYYSFYSNQDIEVDVKMYGGKGSDVGSFSGGEGGWSYLRLNMKKDTEYVIAGLNDYVNAPFLFKKGQLLACVGAGGDANLDGNGGFGGGVSVNGGNAPGGLSGSGGRGGVAPSVLGENGIHGSGSNIIAVSPDTNATTPNAGTTIRCSKGSERIVAACTDYSGNVKFKTSDGTIVTNTKEINRGFKSGYNIFNTGGRSGRGVVDQGWGGSGATGGEGSDRYGGGGGSGYISPDFPNDILVRSEGNAAVVESVKTVETERDTGLEGDGIDSISSTLGGSTGPAKVVISLAEVPTNQLDEFIERPATPNLSISKEDVIRESSFVLLPEIVPPPPIDPPNPRMSITSVVSKGFNSGNVTYTTFSTTSRIGVLETGSLDVFIKTEEIPTNTKFYWKIDNGTTSNADFLYATGNFTTLLNSNGVGSFTINPIADNLTEFISGDQTWKFTIYTDPAYNYPIASFPGIGFKLLDNSLSAPSVTIDLANNSGSTPGTNIKEGAGRTIKLNTLNIPHSINGVAQSLNWYIVNESSQNADFVTTSGTITFGTSTNCSSNYALNVDGVPSPRVSNLATANQGVAQFGINIVEDQTTESGTEIFGIKIEYNGTTLLDTTKISPKKTIKILDTSQDISADITANGSVDEGSNLNVSLSTKSTFGGDRIYWLITDDATNLEAGSSDFESTKGFVTVSEPTITNPRTGTASFTIKPLKDSTTEGNKTYKIKLYSDVDRTVLMRNTSDTADAVHGFTVNDVSLSAESHLVTIDGFDTDQTKKESSSKINIELHAWNLTVDNDAGKRYWKIFEYGSNESAIGGTGKEKDKLADFEVVAGEGNFTRFGYVKTSGVRYPSTDIKSTSDVSTGHIVPYHRLLIEIDPVSDFADDDDKDFEVRFYENKNDRDNVSGGDVDNYITDGVSPKLTVEDDSGAVFRFNKVRGYGTTQINALGGNITSGLNEGTTYSYRFETSALPGEQFRYFISASATPPTIVAKDFDAIETFTLPQSTSYPVKANTYYEDPTVGTEGEFDTFAIPDNFSDDPSGRMRSVGYIFVKPTADKTTESSETFNIDVYRGSEFAAQLAGIKINDTSQTPVVDPPTISLSLNINGNTTNGGSTTVEANTNITDATILWTITGENIEGGIATGFDDNAFNPKPSLSSDWYLSSDSASFTISKKEPGAPASTVTFTMSVYNRNSSGTKQSAEADVTLNINAPKAPETTTYYRYLAVPLYRYRRVGGGGNTRFAHTLFGPGAPAASSVSGDFGDALGDIFPEPAGEWRYEGSPCSVFTQKAPGTFEVHGSTVTESALDGPFFTGDGNGDYGSSSNSNAYIHFGEYLTDRGPNQDNPGTWNLAAIDFAPTGADPNGTYCYIGKGPFLATTEYRNVSDSANGKLIGGGNGLTDTPEGGEWRVYYKDGDVTKPGLILSPKLGSHYWRQNPLTVNYVGQVEPTGTNIKIIDRI